jgi:hypothetical protein
VEGHAKVDAVRNSLATNGSLQDSKSMITGSIPTGPRSMMGAPNRREMVSYNGPRKDEPYSRPTNHGSRIANKPNRAEYGACLARFGLPNLKICSAR